MKKMLLHGAGYIVLLVALILFLLVMLILPVAMVFRDDGASRDTIIEYVNEHYELLENFPYEKIEELPDLYPGYENIDKRDEYQTDIVKEYLGNGTIVKSVYAYNDNVLSFYCGGSGLSTGSTSTGFYHSKNDTPFGLEFNGEGLIEITPGVFEWKNEDGTHKIQTEKVRDHWYYYIMDWY